MFRYIERYIGRNVERYSIRPCESFLWEGPIIDWLRIRHEKFSRRLCSSVVGSTYQPAIGTILEKLEQPVEIAVCPSNRPAIADKQT